jgi:hypothetical protein
MFHWTTGNWSCGARRMHFGYSLGYTLRLLDTAESSHDGSCTAIRFHSVHTRTRSRPASLAMVFLCSCIMYVSSIRILYDGHFQSIGRDGRLIFGESQHGVHGCCLDVLDRIWHSILVLSKVELPSRSSCRADSRGNRPNVSVARHGDGSRVL